MAVMYPADWPAEADERQGRRSERRIFERLKEQVSDSFTIFYSVRWQAKDEQGKLRDGEADFLVCHPDLGVLVLEAKGGRLAFEGHRRQWYRISEAGRRRKVDDPVRQARHAHHTLLDKVRERCGWQGDRWLTIGHGLVFPDCELTAEPLPPDLDPVIILDAAGLVHPEARLRAMFDYYRTDGRDGALGADRLQELVDLFVQPRCFRSPLIAPDLGAIDEQLLELTEQQLWFLGAIRSRRRALIRGCAGSGKTLLMLEKARQLAADGLDVLITCFNKPLGDHLERCAPPEVTAHNFHEYCWLLGNDAGLLTEVAPSPGQNYFDVLLPELLVKASRQLDRRFDAILVDEGQDFKDTHWLALIELLREPDNGFLYVFYDSSQRLYDGVDATELDARLALLSDEYPFELTRNCRNTRPIHRLLSAFHGDGQDLTCLGPDGPPVTLIRCGGAKEQVKAARRLVHQYTTAGGIAPERIAILTGHGLHGTAPFAPGTTLGNYRLTETEPTKPGEILISTALRFKGLERQAVILADFDADTRPSLNAALYVACSRARSRLAILVGPNFPEPTITRLLAAGAVEDPRSDDPLTEDPGTEDPGTVS